MKQVSTAGVKLVLSLSWLFGLPPTSAFSQSNKTDSSESVKFGGFLDTYYAYDFNRPPLHDRAFTTQAARHDEFNINLAFLEANIAARRLRGRIAVQFGTSVQANYAAEPAVGAVSGANVSRFLQEAVVGYQVTQRLWLDAGVFLSAFGSENWISRDNWTYTRSLIAENSPYYESGVKATWKVSKLLTTQVHIINGWQVISENNFDKALGLRVDYTPSSKLNLTYDAFVGNEAADTSGSASRIWHEGILTLVPERRLELRGTVDHGVQHNGDGRHSWWGYSAIGRYTFSRKVHAAIRSESFVDDDQVIVATNLPYGFRANGWSMNADVEPIQHLLWRLEFRQINGRAPLFPSATTNLSRTDRLAVTSVALTF